MSSRNASTRVALLLWSVVGAMAQPATLRGAEGAFALRVRRAAEIWAGGNGQNNRIPAHITDPPSPTARGGHASIDEEAGQ